MEPLFAVLHTTGSSSQLRLSLFDASFFDYTATKMPLLRSFMLPDTAAGFDYALVVRDNRWYLKHGSNLYLLDTDTGACQLVFTDVGGYGFFLRSGGWIYQDAVGGWDRYHTTDGASFSLVDSITELPDSLVEFCNGDILRQVVDSNVFIHPLHAAPGTYPNVLSWGSGYPEGWGYDIPAGVTFTGHAVPYDTDAASAYASYSAGTPGVYGQRMLFWKIVSTGGGAPYTISTWRAAYPYVTFASAVWDVPLPALFAGASSVGNFGSCNQLNYFGGDLNTHDFVLFHEATPVTLGQLVDMSFVQNPLAVMPAYSYSQLWWNNKVGVI